MRAAEIAWTIAGLLFCMIFAVCLVLLVIGAVHGVKDWRRREAEADRTRTIIDTKEQG